MASKMDPNLDKDGKAVNWDLAKIPPTKPFVHIVTSALENVTTFDNMHFIKTRSLIYTSYHKEARNIDFEIGYQKEKWFEHLSDKWMNFANFFVAGFLEAIYTTNENGLNRTYAQINAKIIDCDMRFKHPNFQSDNKLTLSSPSSSSTNVFAQRRNKISSENSPCTPKPISNSSFGNTTPTPKNDSINLEDEESVNDNVANEKETSTKIISSRKRQLSDLCNDEELNNPSDDDEPNNPSDDDEPNKEFGKKAIRGGRSRRSRGQRKIQEDREGREGRKRTKK